MFLRKSVLKIYSKFTGEHPCRSVISIKLHIFRTPFPTNSSGGQRLLFDFTDYVELLLFSWRFFDVITQWLDVSHGKTAKGFRQGT